VGCGTRDVVRLATAPPLAGGGLQSGQVNLGFGTDDGRDGGRNGGRLPATHELGDCLCPHCGATSPGRIGREARTGGEHGELPLQGWAEEGQTKSLHGVVQPARCTSGENPLQGKGICRRLQ